MIAVADTSPLNYLILIHEIDVLPVLFGRVIVPDAVLKELLDPLSPVEVRSWAERTPAWVEIRSPLPGNDLVSHGLGAGESEAIQIALDDEIGRVLIDEAMGRTVAKGLALQVEGTLGILARAADLGIIEFNQAFRRLERTNFRMSSWVRASFLKRNI